MQKLTELEAAISRCRANLDEVREQRLFHQKRADEAQAKKDKVLDAARRVREQKMKVYNAAVKIQSCTRGYFVRKIFAIARTSMEDCRQMREERVKFSNKLSTLRHAVHDLVYSQFDFSKAAVKIQSWWKGILARRVVMLITTYNQIVAFRKKVNDAASRIAAGYHGYIARREYTHLLGGAVERKKMERAREQLRLDKAATKIQKLARGYFGRLRVKTLEAIIQKRVQAQLRLVQAGGISAPVGSYVHDRRSVDRIPSGNSQGSGGTLVGSFVSGTRKQNNLRRTNTQPCDQSDSSSSINSGAPIRPLEKPSSPKSRPSEKSPDNRSTDNQGGLGTIEEKRNPSIVRRPSLAPGADAFDVTKFVAGTPPTGPALGPSQIRLRRGSVIGTLRTNRRSLKNNTVPPAITEGDESLAAENTPQSLPAPAAAVEKKRLPAAIGTPNFAKPKNVTPRGSVSVDSPRAKLSKAKVKAAPKKKVAPKRKVRF